MARFPEWLSSLKKFGLVMAVVAAGCSDAGVDSDIASAEESAALTLYGPNVVKYEVNTPIIGRRLVQGTRVEGGCSFDHAPEIPEGQSAYGGSQLEFDPDTCRSVMGIHDPAYLLEAQNADGLRGESDVLSLDSISLTEKHPALGGGATVAQ